jgi:hypothetical protein
VSVDAARAIEQIRAGGPIVGSAAQDPRTPAVNRAVDVLDAVAHNVATTPPPGRRNGVSVEFRDLAKNPKGLFHLGRVFWCASGQGGEAHARRSSPLGSRRSKNPSTVRGRSDGPASTPAHTTSRAGQTDHRQRRRHRHRHRHRHPACHLPRRLPRPIGTPAGPERNLAAIVHLPDRLAESAMLLCGATVPRSSSAFEQRVCGRDVRRFGLADSEPVGDGIHRQTGLCQLG